MRRLIPLLLTLSLVAMAACGSSAIGGPAYSGTPAPTPYPTPSGGLADRPSTPVRITLVSPIDGEVVHGGAVLVQVVVTGGIVTRTVTAPGDVNPTEGHVHLYLNNQLILMAYTLREMVSVKPGLEYAMYAEFVAQDHFPFYPRDVTPTVYFRVESA